MKRRSLIISLAVLAVVVVAAGVVFSGVLGMGDDEVRAELGELYVANLTLANAVSERSCECLRVWDHDESDVEFCLEAGGVSEEEQEFARACIADASEEMASVPTEQAEKFIECGWEAHDETLACIDGIEKEELCDRESPLESTLELLECVTPGHWERWADCMDEVDEETTRWLEEFSEELERRECLGDRGVFDGGEEVEEVGFFDDAAVGIGMGAIFVDGREVTQLSRGELATEPDELGPVEPLREPFEEMDVDTYVTVNTHSLVPYRTMILVLFTATEVGFFDFSSEPSALSDSNFDAQFLDEMPEWTPGEAADAAEDSEESNEPLDLTIAVGHDGFYVGTEDAARLPPLEGCDEGGPTVCLADDEFDPEEAIERARSAYESGDPGLAAEHYDEALAAYDFRRLYNLLSELNDDYPGESVVKINADDAVSMGLVHHVMETAAVRLAQPYYDDDASYHEDRIEGRIEGRMFPDAAFTVVQ